MAIKRVETRLGSSRRHFQVKVKAQVRPGPKFDTGKLSFENVPWDELEEYFKVTAFGAKKYEAFSWQRVPNMRKRYFSALMRHVLAWAKGEQLDQETKLHHLAHAVSNCFFLMWSDRVKG